MILRRFLLPAVAALMAAAPLAAAADAGDSPIYGVWRNPKNSVHVQIRACESGACGYVVWANAKAKADALEGSGKPLIGQELFRGFDTRDQVVWRGRVYVPDLDRTLSGSAELVNANTLRARGCLIGRVLCKSQAWTRLQGMTD